MRIVKFKVYNHVRQAPTKRFRFTDFKNFTGILKIGYNVYFVENGMYHSEYRPAISSFLYSWRIDGRSFAYTVK